MLKEILQDSKAVAMIITSVGGIILCGLGVWIIGGAILQGFNQINDQMANSNMVISANTEAVKQMNSLLLQVISNRNLKAGVVQSLESISTSAK